MFKSFPEVKHVLILLSIVIIALVLSSIRQLINSYHVRSFVTKIGVIVPLEHEAMTQIISGIKESLSGQEVEFVIKNAQGDVNIMSTMIRQLKDEDVDIVIPIGTSTSQLTISHIKNKPIICTAAIIAPSIGPRITGVNDEIPITYSLSKIASLKKIAVIYSTSEKVAAEVEALQNYGKEHGVNLHLVMVPSLVELPLAISNIPKDIQAFLILKDHLIVSGINILIQEAHSRYIPVIASDEGSVIEGATLSIGVKEKDIGIKAGLIAKEVINGKAIETIPYQNLDKLTIFINPKSFAKQNILTKQMLRELDLPLVERGDV